MLSISTSGKMHDIAQATVAYPSLRCLTSRSLYSAANLAILFQTTKFFPHNYIICRSIPSTHAEAKGNIVTVTKHTHWEGCFIMLIIYINKIYIYNKTFRMYGG